MPYYELMIATILTEFRRGCQLLGGPDSARIDSAAVCLLIAPGSTKMAPLRQATQLGRSA